MNNILAWHLRINKNTAARNDNKYKQSEFYFQKTSFGSNLLVVIQKIWDQVCCVHARPGWREPTRKTETDSGVLIYDASSPTSGFCGFLYLIRSNQLISENFPTREIKCLQTTSSPRSWTGETKLTMLLTAGRKWSPGLWRLPSTPSSRSSPGSRSRITRKYFKRESYLNPCFMIPCG